MGLLLNGEDFVLDAENVKKYGKQMKFYVGKQYIKRRPHSEENSREFDIARTCIPTQYFMRKNTKTPGNKKDVQEKVGLLVYYETVEFADDGKRKLTKPPVIAIGGDDKGHIVVDSLNYELNFFLDNHPLNEVVKNNPEHPNHDPKVEAQFATFVPAKLSEDREDFFYKKSIILNILTRRDMESAGNEHQCDHDKLKAMSLSLLRSSGRAGLDMNILADYDVVEEEILRERLCRLAEIYPFNIFKAYMADDTNWAIQVQEWKEIGVLALEKSDWVFKRYPSTREVILTVPQNVDTEQAIVNYFEVEDIHGKWFSKVRDAAVARSKNKKKQTAS